MAIPRNRKELKEWIYRDLGAPVIDVNIADEQVEDRIDEALNFWQEYHWDATQKQIIAIEITEEDIENKYFTLDDKVVAVTKVFKGRSYGGYPKDELFNLDYQLRLNDLWDLSNVQLGGYVLARQHVALLDDVLNTDVQYRFRRYEGNRLYLDVNWDYYTEGQFIVIEAYELIDPAAYEKIYGERTFRQLAAAYCRKQWGANLSKYQEITLPGGVKLNGDRIYQQAIRDIALIEQDFQAKYSEPLGFFIG